jgi:hypothetical protein
VVLVALVLAACSHRPTGPTGSGIEGHTLVDGGCPPAKDAPPCPDKPVPARITVTRADSDEPVAEVTSGPDGAFRIPLPAGRYTLRPANLTGTLLPATQPLDVDVHPDRYTTVTVPFDSGVRDAPTPPT